MYEVMRRYNMRMVKDLSMIHIRIIKNVLNTPATKKYRLLTYIIKYKYYKRIVIELAGTKIKFDWF